MDKKDPYNFEKTQEGLKKRYKVIVSRRKAYRKKRHKGTSGQEQQ